MKRKTGNEENSHAERKELPHNGWLRGKFKTVADVAVHALVTDAVTVGGVSLLMRAGASVTTGVGVAAVAFGTGKGLYSYGSDYVRELRQSRIDGHHVNLLDGHRARKATLQFMMGTASGIFGAWIFQPGTLKLGIDIISKVGGDTIGGIAQDIGSKFLTQLGAEKLLTPAVLAATGGAVEHATHKKAKPGSILGLN